MRTKIMAIAILVGISVVLGGCAVVPAGPAVYQQRTAQPTFVAEDDGAPPAEYIVEGEPVYYPAEPGVAFYPVFLGYPGSCFCIMPVRFVGGVWYAPGRVVVHHGSFTFHRPGPAHLGAWRGNHGAFGGHAAVRGRIERGPGGRVRAIPPAGVHAQQRQMQRAPTAAPHQQTQVRPAAVQQSTPIQGQTVRPPQQQARPPQQQARQPAPRPAPQRAPAKAPVKKACGGSDQPKCK